MSQIAASQASSSSKSNANDKAGSPTGVPSYAHSQHADDPGTVLAGLKANSQESAAYQRCLLKLIAAWEPAITPFEVLEAMPECEDFSIVELNNCMAELGYHSEQIDLTPGDIDPRIMPCIFMPAGKAAEPIVILGRTDNGEEASYSVFDGSTAIQKTYPASDLKFSNTLGQGVFYRKKSASELSTSKTVREDTKLSWFGATLLRFTNVFWQLMAIGVLVNILALATPIFVMVIYDRVISPQNTDNIPALLSGAAIAIVLELALRRERIRLLSWLTARIHYIVGSEIFRRLIDLPPQLIQHASITAQISRIRSFESVRDFFSGPTFSASLELPSVLISVTVLLLFSAQMALIPVVSALCFIATFLVLRRSISHAIKVAATETSIAQAFCAEALQYQDDIRANGLTDHWKQKFREISGRENAASAKLLFLTSMGEHLSYGISIMAGVVALLVGVSHVWDGTFSTGMLVASMILIWRAVAPFASICSQIARFEQFRNSARQINKLMDLATEEEERNAVSRVPKLSGRIEFQNVSLKFSREVGPVFYGLNLQIARGEAIGICGAMGAGKSSLLELVQSSIQSSSGKVLLDDLNVTQLDARGLRQQIAYIPQVPQAYPGTIAENLRIVRPEATDEELWDVLDEVAVRSQVKALPGGLSHNISSTKTKHDLLLRLSFARLFLKDASIILIDEFPSHLMTHGIEQIINNLAAEVRGKKTMIFVSQRVDQLRLADRVIGMRHGRSPIIGTLDNVLEATS